jgi:hypothetical protein
MSTRHRTLLLFVVFHALYALTSSGNVFRIPDEFETYFQVERFVDAGDLSVPQTLAIRQPVIVNGRVVGTQSMFFGEIGRDGRPYAPYGPLAALLALPHHLAGRLIATAAGVPRAPLPNGIAWLVVVGGVTMLATATAGALAVAGLHETMLAIGAPPRQALAMTILLGIATPLWPYSTSFFSEAWQAAAFIWAAALLLRARRSPRAVFHVAAAATLVAAAGLTKVTSLVFAPAFVVGALLDRSMQPRDRLRTTAAIGAAIAIAAGVHVWWNLHRFARPFDFGYDWAETIPQLPARAFLAADIPRGLAVLLLSPGKSIVLWAPPIMLTVIGWHRFRREQPALAAGIGVATITGLLFFAAYLFPEGGYCHGPRNLVPILPLMLLPAATVDLSGRARPLVIACAVVGFGIAALATAVSYLEDQSLGGDLAAGARTVYYERIEPPSGRVWNRYRFDYITFAGTLRSPGWLSAPELGQGPDYFPLHLLQARRQLPDGQGIPVWLVLAWPLVWIAIGAASAGALARTPVTGESAQDVYGC